jgi:hypothetical protein
MARQDNAPRPQFARRGWARAGYLTPINTALLREAIAWPSPKRRRKPTIKSIELSTHKDHMRAIEPQLEELAQALRRELNNRLGRDGAIATNPEIKPVWDALGTVKDIRRTLLSSLQAKDAASGPRQSKYAPYRDEILKDLAEKRRKYPSMGIRKILDKGLINTYGAGYDTIKVWLSDSKKMGK